MASSPEEAIALTVRFAGAVPAASARQPCARRKTRRGVFGTAPCASACEAPTCPRVLHEEKSHCPADLDDRPISAQTRLRHRAGRNASRAWRRGAAAVAFLYRNSIHPADRFNLPAQKLVEDQSADRSVRYPRNATMMHAPRDSPPGYAEKVDDPHSRAAVALALASISLIRTAGDSPVHAGDPGGAGCAWAVRGFTQLP